MAEVIRMPRLSDTMEEGNIVAWMKKVGDQVSPGDILAEVETDKATMDLESFEEGYLLHIGIPSGPVPVDAVIAVIGDKGEDFQALLDAAASAPSAEAEKETAEPVEAQPVAVASSDSNEQSHSTANTTDTHIKASPLAKKMAAEAGVEIALLTGTGEQGRIVKKDVELFLKNGPATSKSSTPSAVITPASNISYGDKPVSQMRKVIAKRLAESKFTAPHFYLTIEIDMNNTWASRKQLNDAAGVKISFNDIILKACAAALRKHPAVNSSWMDTSIRYNEEINIGVAVAVEDGLMVPVIKNADQKSLTYINTEVKELAGLARDRRLSPDQMSGNTFTISNLGMFGIEEFTAIINPPDSCILAVGGIQDKAVVHNGEIVARKRMKVTLSCDHRVVDGATGSQFLQTLKLMIENPVGIML